VFRGVFDNLKNAAKKFEAYKLAEIGLPQPNQLQTGVG
jgi:hypothetical protein